MAKKPEPQRGCMWRTGDKAVVERRSLIRCVSLEDGIGYSVVVRIGTDIGSDAHGYDRENV